MIEAREISRKSVNPLLRLKVREDQALLVASNPVTIAQAHYEPNSWLRGLWSGELPVGLIAMIDIPPATPEADKGFPTNVAYLWRLMIDADQQGKGFGREAMQLAFSQARIWGRSTLCLHVAEKAGSAIEFYRKFGLEPTNRVDDGERLLIGSVRR